MIEIADEVRGRFPTLRLALVAISGVTVRAGRDPELEELVRKGVEEIKSKYRLETLKDMPIFRAYRDFFWSLGIDPTKDRPSAEALVRRVLSGKPFPAINNLVDAYNLASMLTGIPIATFDLDAISGGRAVLRFARPGEVFLGIGMKKPAVLTGKELVIADREGPVAIYPHRDSDRTKITSRTERALVVACGAPGVSKHLLTEAARKAADLIVRFCGGTAGDILLV